MFDYIQKFDQLPAEIRKKISNPQMTSLIDNLENKYGVELVKTIMQVMIKDISLDYLGLYFMEEFGLSGEKADQLVQDLYKFVFSEVADYLGLEPSKEEFVSKEQNMPQSSPFNKQAKIQIGDKLITDSAQAQPDKAVLTTAQPAKSPLASFDNSQKNITKSAKEEISSKPLSQQAEAKSNNINKQKIKSQALQTTKKQLKEDFSEAKENKILLAKEQGSDNVLAGVLSQVKIIFSSQKANQRLQQVVRTYLRGVRKRPEAKMILTNSYQKGGLGLSEQEAEEILDLADKSRSDFMAVLARETAAGYPESHILPAEKRTKQPLPAIVASSENKKTESRLKIEVAERDVPYNLSELPTKSPTLKKDKIKALSNSKLSAGAPKPANQSGKKQNLSNTPTLKLHGEDSFSDQVLQAKEQEQVKAKIEASKISQSKANQSKTLVINLPKRPPTTKPRLDDVTYVPRVMGPIDELRQMSLLDFRRLNPDPVRACQKIKEKIELLGEEQYTKRIEAIKAWRQSPVNKIYAQIGQQSIVSRQPVEKIIALKKQAGDDCLTMAEFEAIMDLNKELRF